MKPRNPEEIANLLGMVENNIQFHRLALRKHKAQKSALLRELAESVKNHSI